LESADRAGLIERDCNTCALHQHAKPAEHLCFTACLPTVGVPGVTQLPFWQPIQALLPRPRPTLVKP
jgi:hypothetical protein